MTQRRDENLLRQRVSDHPALTPFDKLLWMRLRDEQLERGTVMQLSVVAMAALAGVSTRNVHRSLLTLQNAGLLRRWAEPGRVASRVQVLDARGKARVITRNARP